MAGLIGTSFAIFELFGRFGPFHAMSLVSGGTLARFSESDRSS